MFVLVYEIIEYFSLEGNAGMFVVLGGILLCIAAGYLLGSLNTAIILSRLIFHDDIRRYGSGNAGTTNMLRTYGKKYAALTLVLDMAKTVLVMLLGYLIYWRSGAAIAGFFCVLGHMFPLYYHFKGGKGVACTAIVALMISPLTALALVFCFVVIVVFTKFVSLASVMCALLYPLFLRAFLQPGIGYGASILMSILTTGFIVFMHRENIKRLYEGKESKISFGAKKDPPDSAGKGEKK